MYSQNLINSCGSIPACAGETRWASRWPTKMRVYPRLCGGNTTIHSQESGFLGLSPLVRGKLLVLRFLMLLVGSIPACAGETRGRRQNVRPARVYPRLCGGNDFPPFPPGAVEGLSPLVRGKQVEWIYQGQSDGSIPACAGETVAELSMYRYQVGLSPLVRGKHVFVGYSNSSSGSIPACAGETR